MSDRPVSTGIYGLRLLAQPGPRLAVAVLMAVIFVIARALQLADLTTQPQWGYDLSFYWTAASRLLDGLPIYSAAQLAGPYAPQGQDGFLYPPPFAALSIPLVWLAPQGARVAEWIWSGLGLVVVVVVTLAVVRSERLAERFALLRGRGRWLLVAAAVTFPPVIGELSIGNVHLLLLGLFTLAWLGLRRGDARGDWMAGVGLGFAAVVKVFPAVLLLWLIATRRLRAAVSMVVAGAALAVATLPITGLEPWLQYPTVLANLAAVADTTDTISPTIWLAPYLGFTPARWLVTAVGVALLLWSAWRDGRQPVPAVSFGLAVALSVLIAPNVFHHYLAILVLPMALALGAGVRLRWIALAYVLMSGGQQAAFGDLAWIVNRALPTLGALVLLASLAWPARPLAVTRPGPSPAPAG
ncbi:MAG TPA: glycosyltransferase family 87 protein [Candidatus Binatia bacterium]|nr:glycosyltransferase family 87 protein [Candidatus Binatia bacterium]